MKPLMNICISVLLILLTTSAGACLGISDPPVNDTTIRAEIRKVLIKNAGKELFHFPNSVERLYSQSEYQPLWVKSEGDIRKTWEALLMLDCVLQFGLNHDDYHPNELSWSMMHDMLDSTSKIDPIRKAWFDMLLSDALIAFMNHLHFGKLNPVLTGAIIDKGEVPGFCADDVLKDAMKQTDFMSAILDVQPKVREYVLMQNYMKLMKGQYLDDCYEVPEGLIRKLAINMERLRWAAIHEETFIQINIPSYTLKLFVQDTTYSFKVVVGKPSSPTPVLQSLLTHFETAPDWLVPKNIFIKEMLPKALKNPQFLERNHLAIYDLKGDYLAATKDRLEMVKKNPQGYYMRQSSGCDNALGRVVFRFQNTSGIYLHDTPEQQFFDRDVRALSHGCIRVKDAEMLAGLLLDWDGQQQKNKDLHQAMANYKAERFNLGKPMPLKITYLTCEMKEEGIVEYEDVYKQDKILEMAFYGSEKQ